MSQANGVSNDIILFNFPESVFGRRMVRYLNLRRLTFSQIRVPPNMPRPILQQQLGINYRRIPVLAIGRDIYIDTRLQLRKLETLFPDGRLGATSSWDQGFEEMLEGWVIDGGPFWRTSGCIPVSVPFVNDPVWMKDRFDGSGGAFTREALIENRSWCISQLRLFYSLIERMLADGREWILGGSKPSLAELHAGWVYDWGVNMSSDMRDASDDSTGDMAKSLGKDEFPNLHAWVGRWRKATEEAERTNPGAGTMDEGDEAENDIVRRILAGSLMEPRDLEFDDQDVLGLKKGQRVSIAPVDFGFTHKDEGPLVSLSKEEAVIEVDVPVGKDGKLRLHYPRINFKILPV